MMIKEKISEISGIVLGIVVILAMISIPVLLIAGGAWAATHLLQPLINIGWIILIVDIVILLPLSIFRRLRFLTGTLIIISSFLFGLLAWLVCFISTYDIFGFWAAVIGVVLFASAIIPFALVGAAIKGIWILFFTIIVLFALTFGLRVVGALIASKG